MIQYKKISQKKIEIEIVFTKLTILVTNRL